MPEQITVIVQRVRTEYIEAKVEVDMADFAEWSEGDTRDTRLVMAEYLQSGRDWPANVRNAAAVAGFEGGEWHIVDSEYSVKSVP